MFRRRQTKLVESPATTTEKMTQAELLSTAHDKTLYPTGPLGIKPEGGVMNNEAGEHDTQKQFDQEHKARLHHAHVSEEHFIFPNFSLIKLMTLTEETRLKHKSQ
ncbi:hypothetical protein L6164_019094 [Bauhinia variegata]|uniref:Uncharacterized protein n=1 Tax=Bauhinia variegata TaxID=167791 RepID=A0ACB9NGR1_BAUVA|nr:hypothetical protein L6164_019094 [Bauhinia variegata]